MFEEHSIEMCTFCKMTLRIRYGVCVSRARASLNQTKSEYHTGLLYKDKKEGLSHVHVFIVATNAFSPHIQKKKKKKGHGVQSIAAKTSSHNKVWG